MKAICFQYLVPLLLLIVEVFYDKTKKKGVTPFDCLLGSTVAVREVIPLIISMAVPMTGTWRREPKSTGLSCNGSSTLLRNHLLCLVESATVFVAFSQGFKLSRVPKIGMR